MPRAVVLNFSGEVSELPLTRVDRSKLYGSKKKVIADETGEPCSAMWLTADGQTMIPSNGLSAAYVDANGSSIERSGLVQVNEEGDVLDKLPSTLGGEVELYGPVPASRLLDHKTISVYEFDPSAIGDKLSAALDAGEIFETEFRYTASATTNAIFIVRNDEGTFGLVSQPVDMPFVQPEAQESYADIDDDEDEDDDDDLDFSF